MRPDTELEALLGRKSHSALLARAREGTEARISSPMRLFCD